MTAGKMKVGIPDWLHEKRHTGKRKPVMMYLVILHKNGVEDQFSTPVDEKFDNVVKDHLDAYLNEGKMPPDEIAPAILNLADDQMSGRDLTLRAGDYIAIRNFMKKK